MKIRSLYFTLLILALKSSHLFCAHRAKKPTPKPEINLLVRTNTRRELVQENLALRARLKTQKDGAGAPKIDTLSAPSQDLEKGEPSPIAASAGTGVTDHTPTRMASITRRRTSSTHSDDSDLEAAILANQTATHRTMATVLEQQTSHQKEKWKYNRRTRFIATAFGVGNILLTVGLRFGPAIIHSLTGSGPDGSSSNSTST